MIHIQPDEGISLRFEGKVPGPFMRLGTVKMHFQYEDYFGATPNTGYETLLYDVMTADSTLFHRSDMVEAGWSVVTPILDVWRALTPRNFPNYAAGTWGPKEADETDQGESQMETMTVRVVDEAELARAAAEDVALHAEEAVRERGRFSIALSGGSTPPPLYRLLADPDEPFRGRMPWERVHVFWGDERHVPPDHPDSNFRLAHDHLLSKVPVLPANIHRVRAENPDAERAAAEYEWTLRSAFNLDGDEPPHFDLPADGDRSGRPHRVALSGRRRAARARALGRGALGRAPRCVPHHASRRRC